MKTQDVLRAVGEPLCIGLGQHPDESVWRYGCLIQFRGGAFPPGVAPLVVTNGAVSESFGVKQPEDDFYRVEILSAPDAQGSGGVTQKHDKPH